MMTSDEIRTIYAELAEILTVSGLGWVVEQVDQTVHAGRAVEKPTRIFREEEREFEPPLFSGEQYGARRAGKPTAMMTLEPWPDSDQLLFLISGVRHAIVHAADIENEQLRLLRGIAEVEAVSFEPDGEATDRKPLRLAGIHDERIQTLSKLLGDLERQVRS
jgi:hypothetical protein